MSNQSGSEQTQAPPQANPFVPMPPQRSAAHQVDLNRIHDDAYIMQIAMDDPAKASALLDLREKLKVSADKETEKKREKVFQKRMLVETNKTEREMIENQNNCEKAGHVRTDGSCALSGQYINGDRSKLMAVCVLCFRTYIGVGSTPGELPPYLAGRINSEILGN